MYEMFRDFILELEVIFFGIFGLSVRLEVNGIFFCFGEVIRGIILEFENVIL